MLLFSCLADTGHCLGFLNCMSLFLHFHFWKLFEVFFFFNGLPTQFLLSFEKTAGIPLQPKSLVTVIVKNCVCTSLLFSSLLFSSLLFSSLLFSSLLFSSLLFSSGNDRDRHAISLNWVLFHNIQEFLSWSCISTQVPKREKWPRDWMALCVKCVSVCVCLCVSVCACLWHWKGQKKVRLIEWDCCRKKGKIKRFLKSLVRWR